MKIIENALKEGGRSWRVPSKSEKGKWYIVSVDKFGEWDCDCPSLKECSHIKICQWKIKK